MLSRGSTSYGRRVRRSRIAPRLPVTLSRRTVNRAQPRPTGPSDSTREIEDLESLRADYSSGELSRIPRSTLCEVTSPKNIQLYDETTKSIATFMREEARRRDGKMALCRKEATSHIAAAKTLTDAANLSQDSETDKATKVSEATVLLEKATNSLTSVATLEKNYDMVFVYDIGEISMLKRNYIAEFSIMFPEIDSYSLFKFTKKIMECVNLTIKEIDEMELVSLFNLTNESDYWRRVGPKYAALKQMYNEFSREYRKGDPVISQELCNKCGMGEEFQHLRKTVAQLQKKIHQRWRLVRKCLELVNQKSRVSPGKYANVILCEEGVGYGAAQLLVSNHNSQIPIDNIYSTSKLSREQIFQRLQRRFGETCVFVYVTSSGTFSIPEMRQVHKWPVEAIDSIRKLCKAQKKYLL